MSSVPGLAVVALTFVPLIAAWISRQLLSVSVLQWLSEGTRRWTVFVTAITSVLHLLLLVVAFPSPMGTVAMGRFVVLVPHVSFALELGWWQKEAKTHLAHHTMGMAGAVYFSLRLSGQYLTVIALLLVDSITAGDRSRSFFCSFSIVWLKMTTTTTKLLIRSGSKDIDRVALS